MIFYFLFIQLSLPQYCFVPVHSPHTHRLHLSGCFGLYRGRFSLLRFPAMSSFLPIPWRAARCHFNQPFNPFHITSCSFEEIKKPLQEGTTSDYIFSYYLQRDPLEHCDRAGRCKNAFALCY